MTDYYYFSRDTGWGDTLWHLTNALLYCEENNKGILIDMRGSWISKGKKNLFNEYFKLINTDIKVITTEEEIDALKKFAEPHSDSRVVIKNPLKSKKDSKKFYDAFKRIQPSDLVSKEVNKIIVNQFSGNYIVGVHGRCSNGEVLPEKKTNSNRFHGEKTPIDSIFEIYKDKIDNVLFESPRAFLRACDNYKFFVASDSKQFVDLFKKEYGNIIHSERYFAPPGCGTGHEKGELSTEDHIRLEEQYGRIKIAREALVDFYLLQNTNYLFKNFSRFNEFCLYKGIPNFHINFQEKCY